ncbi:MAG: hypothetical protein HOW73_05875 [Polyangiaceae bacterium]|nr:hypothetical protein [Polyangiaceae bacterium]
MKCATPIPYPDLVALWVGELAPDAAATFDEHLFECDECAAASDALGRLIGAARTIVPPVITADKRAELAARGLMVRDLAFEPDTEGEAYFAPEIDLMVFALRGDLSKAERVDVDIHDPEGNLLVELLAVPFDAARGEVLVACQQHFRRSPEAHRDAPAFRVYATEGGARRQVGSYVIDHIWPAL